jgi:hypothetical protein
MAENTLHWFPFFAKDWLSSPARMAMSPAQRGAYIDLLAFAWGNGDAEPCLDPDPLILAGLSGLGRDWKRLSPLILAQFKERDGLLYNAKLSSVWRDQQAKHHTAVERGRTGGQKKAANRKLNSSSASSSARAEGVVGSKQSESERLLVGPSDQTSMSPAVALSAEAPRPADPRLMDDSGVRGKPERLREMLTLHAPNLLRPA